MISLHWLLPENLRGKYLYRLVKPYTLVGYERVRSLYQLTRLADHGHIPGDFVECGVFNGGTAAVLAYSAAHSKYTRTTWLFDSFAGMPDTTHEDGEAANEYVGGVIGSIGKVNQVLGRVGAKVDKVKIVKGWFQDTFPQHKIAKIAILNIDADWYESVKLCLETYYDSIVPGGFISIDDYGYWPGCKQAVDEFFVTRKLTSKLNFVDDAARWFQKA